MIDTIVVLAGGLATRLQPITETIPKSMIEISGQPFIAHQMELFYEKGLRNVILCIGHLGHKIKDFVGDGSFWSLKVHYSFDGESLLGTGGAIRNAACLLPDQFFVIYGDSYLDIDYEKVSDFFAKQEKQALMTVYKNDSRYDTSNVIYENNEIKKYDKVNLEPDMQYIDYGLGILKKETIMSLPPGQKYDLAQLYQNLVQSKSLTGYEVKTRFYEIGSVNGIKELEKELNLRTEKETKQ